MTSDELRALADAQAAEIAQLNAALRTCMWALRQPIDGWKGECERKALDEARDALRSCDDSRGTVPAHYARSSVSKIALYAHPAPAAPQATVPAKEE